MKLLGRPIMSNAQSQMNKIHKLQIIMTSRNNIFLTIIVILFSINFSQAQPDIGIGQWKSHLPYQSGKYVTQSAEDIIYATNWGIVYINKNDNSTRTLDKLDGLSGVGIERIKHNQANDILLVAYSNSTIDFVKPNEIITLSDIQRFNNISGDKRIYDIFIDTDSTALLATGYGMSKINFNQDIFVFSTFTGVPMTSVVVKDEMIYATTEEGIYRASNQPNVNLQDFGVWEFLDSNNGFPDVYDSSVIANFSDKIYMSIDTAMYSFDGANLQQLFVPEDGYKIEFVTTEGNHMVVGLSCQNGACDGKLLFFNSDESFSEIEKSCVDRPVHAIEDESGFVWVADNFLRFRSYEIDSKICNPGFTLNSPFDIKNYDLEVNNGQLWVTAGGIDIRNYFQFYFEGLYTLKDGNWQYFNRLNRGDLSGTLDFLRVAFHPEKDIMYASTYYDGLVKYENDIFEIFVDTNSTLGNSTVTDVERTKVTGIAFDQNNNLWIANPGTSKPISVLTDDGEMKNFSVNSNIQGLFSLTVDDNNFKWFTVSEGTAGILVFDEGDLEVTGDERYRQITSASSALSTNNVSCITKDLDGAMWVGTGDGIIIFECGSNVFDTEQCQGTRKIVEQDGIPAYLLVGEDVKAIAVDGANRKWVGTTTGVFVISSDGEELIAKFNTENSPLFDNVITDIAIDPECGEVFIGTSEGIVSYRGEATEGGITHKANALVFPNPVRPEYQGPIAIKGLARDSDVKITDVNGQLVYETVALGGQAIWDGRDYTGRKAATGVYLVLGTTTKSFDEPQTVVAKILFMN